MRPEPAGAFGLGALGAAVLSAICCVGPLLLAIAGLGGGALFLKVAPFRPHLLGASVLLLAGAFFATYRRDAPVCEGSCPNPARSKRQKLFLWIVTAVVVLAAADLIR